MATQTIVERKDKRKPNGFIYRGGYGDRLAGIPPQQWDNVDYRAGYVAAILELAGLVDYEPVSY
jgi:hypothetical protein